MKIKKIGVTDKFLSHSYFNIYNSLFSSLGELEINFLEIGISHGESIRMWLYHFKKANIYAVDIKEAPNDLKEHNRVTTYKADAYQIDFLQNNFIEKNIKFDIIVDDGSHLKKDIIFVAKEYSKLLSPGGLLIIEDIKRYDWVSDIISTFPKTIRQNIVVDLRKNKNRYDDILIIAENESRHKLPLTLLF